jgi:hypothetical protein
MKTKPNPITPAPIKTPMSSTKKTISESNKELKNQKQKHTVINTPLGKMYTVTSESIKDAAKKEKKKISIKDTIKKEVPFGFDPLFDQTFGGLNPNIDQIKEHANILKETNEKIKQGHFTPPYFTPPLFPQHKTSPFMPTPTHTPEDYNNHATVSDTFSVNDEVFHSIPEFMAKYPQPSVPNGIKSEGITAKISINNPTSTLINNLVKNKTYRNTIVKLVTGSNLDDIINETFSPETIKELGIEYVRDVVATSSIIKDYQKFLIWKAGFEFNK